MTGDTLILLTLLLTPTPGCHTTLAIRVISTRATRGTHFVFTTNMLEVTGTLSQGGNQRPSYDGHLMQKGFVTSTGATAVLTEGDTSVAAESS